MILRLFSTRPAEIEQIGDLDHDIREVRLGKIVTFGVFVEIPQT